MVIDPITILMLVVLAVLIFFMFRNGRKRARDAEEMEQKLVAGAEIMTNGGIFGTIVSIDDEENKILLETTPGTILTVHRQTVARIVDPVVASDDDDEVDELEAAVAADAAPEFGERVETETVDKDKKNTDQQ